MRRGRLLLTFLLPIFGSVSCEPVERAAACEKLVSALRPINDRTLRAGNPAEMTEAATTVHLAGDQLTAFTLKQENLEELRLEAARHLQQLEDALRAAGQAHEGKRAKEYEAELATTASIASQLRSLSTRLNTQCR